MKRIVLMTAALTALCILSLSCDDKKEKVETMYSGFMTAHTDADGYISILTDDFGKQFMVSEKTDQLRPDTLYRIVASVALSENQSARIIQMAPTISYIAPDDSIIPDTMRVKDPIEIQSVYIGGGYLNVNLGIKVKKEDTKHSLFYARLNESGKLKFTFYHNAYGDEPIYTKRAYVSIPLYGYGLAKNDTVFLTANGYEKDYDYKLIYK